MNDIRYLNSVSSNYNRKMENPSHNLNPMMTPGFFPICIGFGFLTFLALFLLAFGIVIFIEKFVFWCNWTRCARYLYLPLHNGVFWMSIIFSWNKNTELGILKDWRCSQTIMIKSLFHLTCTVQWWPLEMDQSTVYVVNCHFSRGPNGS